MSLYCINRYDLACLLLLLLLFSLTTLILFFFLSFHSGLEDTMISSFFQIQQTAKKYNVSLRVAAYINAINKVAKVTVGSGRMLSM
jgi:hypothetical protein